MPALIGAFDTRLLDAARRSAESLLALDPELESIELRTLRDRLREFWHTAALIFHCVRLRCRTAIPWDKCHRVRTGLAADESHFGQREGRRLKGPPGPLTRPMADKIREALFRRSLRLESSRCDSGLYAGTGNGVE